jgi:D-glycero-D-manno-heptose 1,7-bisphosphate phosphatase
MKERLLESGVRLDAVQHCPHLPDASIDRYRLDCDCRKPRAGMILRAAGELGIDLGASILVGDRKSDIEAGRAAGVGQCYLVRSGHKLSTRDVASADAVYDDIGACVEHLLAGVPPLTRTQK